MLKKRLILSTLGLFLSLPNDAANADELQDANHFRHLLMQEARLLKPDVNEAQLGKIFFVPDGNVTRSLKARTLEESLEALKGGSLTSLAEATRNAPRLDVPATSLNGKKLTVVLVPGVFAEFIKNRAMEDVLEKPSKLQKAFKEVVARAKEANSAHSVDRTLLLNNFEIGKTGLEMSKETPLDELIHVGEMNVHGAHVRVLLLATPFSSLESLGDAKVRATMFNRRLEKYLALTGPEQPLAFVGYSRGTILGLEMLAQAKAENKPWVKNVRAMVSLSGVVLGSSLADDAAKGERSPTRKLLEGVRKTAVSLEKYPDNAGVLEKARVRKDNDLKWAAFGVEALALMNQMNSGSPIESFKNLSKVDPRAPIGIFTAMWTNLGLNSFWGDYNRNVDRFRYLVDELLASVHEMTAEARVYWFKTRELPKHVTYYGLTAAMANPGANAVEKDLFANPLAYGSGSQDDIMLTQNRKDYEALSGGLALNDSQVSVIQSSFPPGVLESISPAHKGLKTKFLGVATTHHWGMALREVNKMKDGQVNGFPREAMLRALVIQVLQDTN